MQLPGATSHYSVRVRFGRYVGRRLKRAHFDALAGDVTAATAAVLLAGRASEDADAPVQDAFADRDAADDALDLAAQTARVKLAARSADAVREAPYRLIFPEGIGFYLAAPLDQEEARYRLLSERLAAHLPAKDEVRLATNEAIHEGLVAFVAATKELTAARNASAIADGLLESAEEGWQRQMDRAYGALIAEVGRAEAEKFFPKGKPRAKKPREDETPSNE